MGVVHAHAGDTEEIFTVEVDPALANEWRTEFPAANDIVIKPVVTY
jgi:predicted amidohydrolase